MGLDMKDISVWVRGLIGAGISGAATAISSGVSASVIAPDKFNMQDGMNNLLKMIAVTAVISFVTSISKYLAQKPLPEDLP